MSEAEKVEENFLQGLKILNGSLSSPVEELGKGMGGIVKLHEQERSKAFLRLIELVAVKEAIKYEKNDGGQRNENEEYSSEVKFLRNEALILQHVEHENIVKYLGSTAMDDHSCRNVLEFQAFKSLSNFIPEEVSENKSPSLTWIRKLKFQMASNISDGLAFLHKKKILHLDLKPSNILVSYKLVARICDFGCAVDTRTTDVSFNPCMTYSYASPEMLSYESEDSLKPTETSDVYSAGMVFWFMFCEEEPFKNILLLPAASFYSFKHFVVRQKQRPSLEGIPEDFWKQVLENCWTHQPNERISSQILSERLRFKMNAVDRKNAVNHCQSLPSQQSLGLFLLCVMMMWQVEKFLYTDSHTEPDRNGLRLSILKELEEAFEDNGAADSIISYAPGELKKFEEPGSQIGASDGDISIKLKQLEEPGDPATVKRKGTADGDTSDTITGKATKSDEPMKFKKSEKNKKSGKPKGHANTVEKNTPKVSDVTKDDYAKSGKKVKPKKITIDVFEFTDWDTSDQRIFEDENSGSEDTTNYCNSKCSEWHNDNSYHSPPFVDTPPPYHDPPPPQHFWSSPHHPPPPSYHHPPPPYHHPPPPHHHPPPPHHHHRPLPQYHPPPPHHHHRPPPHHFEARPRRRGPHGRRQLPLP